MKFLAILIALTINYLWLKDLDRFDDAWFFRFRRKMEDSLATGEPGSGFADLLPLLFIFGIPILLLGLLLLLLQDTAFGLPSLLLHILVLLVVFDRTQPGNLVKCFLADWRRDDLEACKLYLQQELGLSESVEFSNAETLSEYFKEQLIYRCFEKMFVMFFWYMLTGPLGILFCYISYQLRDTQHENHSEHESQLVHRVIYLLEWIPIRLLAITFSLAGNFVQCFDNLKQSFWQFDPQVNASARLYSYAGCALSGAASGSNEGEGNGTEEQARDSISVQEIEIENLQALLERSQAIWLAVLALITIFGLQTG